LPVLTEGRQLLKAEQLCLLGDVALQPFHAGCVEQGVTVGQLGPMGKVWENGAVQVVQYAESLPEDTHPRNRLPGGLSRRIGECIYAPVYDQTGQGAPAGSQRCLFAPLPPPSLAVPWSWALQGACPTLHCSGWSSSSAAAHRPSSARLAGLPARLDAHSCRALKRLAAACRTAVSQGVVAVVELLVRSQSCDYMVVANAISCLTHLMESLQLSISSPQAPQPSHAAMQAGMARNGSSMQSTTVWGSGGSNGGSSLGRTVSMHTFSG
jgi:hypothetical protein